MKIKILLILLFTLSLGIKSSFASRVNNPADVINLNLRDASLKEVFQLIERQVEYKFMYLNKEHILNKKISINVNDKSLQIVLKELENKTSLSFKISNSTILVREANQQTRMLRGRILDEDKNPIPAANIFIEGTKIGTSSDFEGNFSLEIPTNISIITVTYLGFQRQDINVDGQETVTVTLQLSSSSLDEIVIVGYGQTSKESLVDAVNKINTKTIADRPVANVASSLQGLSPGLNITRSSGKVADSPRINIRGFTSINGGQPLIIIDGVEGDLNNLNPNDVASISILKDAGASAIYGARGAFGVVLITTKSPRSGKITIDYNSTLAFNTPTINTDFVTDPYQAVSLVDEAFRTALGRNYTGYNEDDYAALLEVSQNPSQARVITAMRNGREQYVYYGHTDWWDAFFQKWTPTEIHNVSLSGGSDKIKAYFSYRNFNSEGILKVQDDYYKMYNLRGKLDMEINNWLSFSNNMQYNSSNDLEHGGSQYGWRRIWDGNMYVHALPSYFVTNPDGTATWRTELNNYTIGDGAYASLLQGTSLQSTEEGEFSNIATANLTPFKGMDITASYAYKRTYFNRYERSTEIPYSIYPGIISTMGNDRLTEYYTKSEYDAVNIYGEYTHQLNDHTLKGTLGFNQEAFGIKSITATKMNSISNDLNSLGLATSNPEATGSASEWALQGVFYRFSYDYKDKYIFEANGRYDGTSRFPKDDRWGFFPSFSAGWLVNKEDFFQNLTSVFDMLKIRASYGSLGNQDVADYAYIPTLGISTNQGYAIDGSILNYTSAPDLNPNEITWEEVKTLNIGTDISLLENHINVNFDWFQRETEGMLTQGATLPSVLGTGSPQENAADLRTRGFELSVGYKNSFKLANDPLNFSVTANLSNSKTEITRFDNPNNSLLDFYEGMTIGELWGYHVDGLFQSDEEILGHADQARVSGRIINAGGLQPGDVRYVDLNNDGVISEGENTVNQSGDRRIIGNTAPQYLYSFRLETSWKGFDISAFFQGVGKQDWYPNTDSRIFWAMYNRPYDSFIRKDLANDIWSPENPEGFYPRLFGYIALSSGDALGAINDRYLQSVAYLRLKNLTIGYTIPQTLLRSTPITKLRIYLSGENILTFSDLTDYLDPEAASNAVNLNQPSTSSNRGTAQTIPFNETYSFGISVQF